jgi:hypothetical protein
MRSRLAWHLCLLLASVTRLFTLATLSAQPACDKMSPAPAAAPSSEASTGSWRTAEDACTSDNCVVPLADIEGVCARRLDVATKDCDGVTATTGPCGALTHLQLATVGPAQDCYYDAASGALVGGLVRSDAGFTKIAGTIPPDSCPATTQVCNHPTPGTAPKVMARRASRRPRA